MRTPERSRTQRAGLIGGLVAAGIGAGIAAAIAAERALVRRDQRRPDREALEPLGGIRGEPIDGVVSFDGTRLHVEAVGQGPTIVLSHGFSLDLTTWHYQMRDLPGSYRVVVYDHRGHGRSGMPPGEAAGSGHGGGPGDGASTWSLEALARDLEAVIRAAAPGEPVCVAGHSMGGMTALTFADVFPEAMGSQVAGLVLANTTAADVMGDLLPGAARRARAAIQMLQEGAMRLLARRPGGIDRVRAGVGNLGYIGVRLMGFGPAPSPAQVAFVERLLAQTPGEVWLRLLPHLLSLDVTEVLDSLDVPTLVVSGARDRLTPPGASERIAAAVKGAEHVRIEGAGHMAMLERPDAFNAHLRAHLARLPGFGRGTPA